VPRYYWLYAAEYLDDEFQNCHYVTYISEIYASLSVVRIIQPQCKTIFVKFGICQLLIECAVFVLGHGAHKSLIHGHTQVSFPAVAHHHHLAGTKSYSLMIDARV